MSSVSIPCPACEGYIWVEMAELAEVRCPHCMVVFTAMKHLSGKHQSWVDSLEAESIKLYRQAHS